MGAGLRRSFINESYDDGPDDSREKEKTKQRKR